MSILFITGAGVSIASGIPPFHGENGLYTTLAENVEDVITVHTLKSDPAKFWGVLAPLKSKVYTPNTNHALISKICHTFPSHLIVTQNIDGLHGSYNNDDNVIELHGNMKDALCMECNKHQPLLIDKNDDRASPCVYCGKQVRPDVLLFHEQLDPRLFAKVTKYCKACEYVVTIGTQSQYSYLLAFVAKCKRRGAKHIDINPTVSVWSKKADTHIQDTADIGLVKLEQMFHKDEIELVSKFPRISLNEGNEQ